MREQDITVSNRLGLHARAAAKLVQTVQGFKSTVMLINQGREVNAKSIMGVMMLAAGQGTALTIRADGPDEETALDAAIKLFERKFDEGG
ncbi:MAG TPA: HPr family phosphocarrier protein [Rhodanobacteraceae bacterium]|nr:HPr family phosphocarrier protein [Rhodanobacteraceae bacterium]